MPTSRYCIGVVIPGGTGHVGGFLAEALAGRGHDVVVLSRRAREPAGGVRFARWDGRTAGAWAAEVDGCDAVVNLAGRSVSCRYTDANLREMMGSRRLGPPAPWARPSRLPPVRRASGCR